MTSVNMMLLHFLPCIIILLASERCHSFTVISNRISELVIPERALIAPLLSQNSDNGDAPVDEAAPKSPHLQAIEEALEATRKYGATSKEARMAWEIAEEIEDSIFSPCSKRCDPLPRKDVKKLDIPPLFVDETTLGDEN